MVAHNPLDGSGRAVLPHPALASGDDAEAAQGIRVVGAGNRQPAVNNPPHPVPQHAAALAAPRQRTMPEADHLEPKQAERWNVHGDSEVSIVPRDHRAQPLSHFRDGVVHASLEFGFHLAQLGLQPRTNRLPQHREPSVAPLLSADVRSGSGRAMALIGLRMMPTFPSPSLRFRTAGFPRYGSKAGCQSVPSQGKGSITSPPWFASDLRVVSRCSFVLARS